MFNNVMKKALMKRKSDLEQGFTIKLEIEPKSSDEEQKEKESALAPTVKDQAPDKKAHSKIIEPPLENAEGPGQHEGDEDEMGEIELPVELPTNREPMTLGEKASSLMKKDKEKLKLKKE